MKIFSTLHPEQIDERRTNAEGVLGLKRFLQFARQENGTSDETSATGNNLIIGQIASRLRNMGFDVRTSIGKSALKVDVAVVHPTDPQKYILGIICDGNSYYRLKTMRDREMVQPSVLRMLGWNLMHIWSIDWLLHQDAIIKQIVEKITTSNCRQL